MTTDDDVTPSDVIKVLTCNLNLLEITLLGENIGPSASMEMEQNAEMIKKMIGRLKLMADRPFIKSTQKEKAIDKTPNEKCKSKAFSLKRKEKEVALPKPETTVVSATVKDNALKASESPAQKEEPHFEEPQVEVEPEIIIDEGTYEVTDSGANENEAGANSQVDDGIVVEDGLYELTPDGNNLDVDSLSASVSDHSVATSIASSDDDSKAKLKEYQALSFDKLKEQASCASYLQKHKKNRLLGQWHKRYCLLVDCFIFYYKSENSSKDKGVINLNTQKVEIPPKSFAIHLNAIDKSADSYTLQADTSEDFEKWKYHLAKFACSNKSTLLDNDIKSARSISMITDMEQNEENPKEEIEDQTNDKVEEIQTMEKDQAGESEKLSVDNIFMGLYDCVADSNDELSFKSGDVVYILDRVNSDWWLGCLNGRCGYVPSVYMTTPFL